MKNHLVLMNNGAIGQIKIGYVGDFLHSIFPDILSELKRVFPQIDMVLLESDTESQIKTLRIGLLDIGFICIPNDAKDVTVKPYYKKMFSLILLKSRSLSSIKNIPLKELADGTYILSLQGTPHNCAIVS